RLTGLPEGKIRLVVKSLGYELYKDVFPLDGEGLEITLEPIFLPGQDIIVTGDRARRRETPVAFTNIPQREIENTYWAQDMPMLLTQTPGVYAYSDNGNGIGYSYLSVRGFPQSRVAVIINGVPHNDPESHEVYWIDMPDFPASVQDIQIQRGVGSSMYGSAAIGGTININTSYANPHRDVKVTTGIGSFGTRKVALDFNSGLVDNTYNVYGRFSRLVSDGYRDLAWTDQWAYFLGVARYDGRLTNRFQVYGGQEETHLAYKGIRENLLSTDRTYNPQEYAGEIDHFDQPHYELLTNWKLDDRFEFDNTLFYIKGKGYYDQFRTDRSYGEYNLTEFTDAGGRDIEETDLVRRRFVENDFWGLVPRVTYRQDKLRLALGAELNSHRGVHTGTIVWAEILPPDSVQVVAPDHKYYDYEGRKLSGSAFINAEYAWTPQITTMTALQYQYRRYELLNDHRNGINHVTPYSILSPRAGVNVNLTEQINVFANAAYTRQEPSSDEIFDPQDYWSSPADYFNIFDAVTGRGEDPIMEPEKLLDLEFGGGYRAANFTAEANLYWMRFEDEIVYNGGLSDDGVPIRVNAPVSIHRGLELSASARPFADSDGQLWRGLELSGNFSYADNYFDEFDEYLTDWSDWPPPIDTVSRDGNPIAGFPDLLTNLRASYSYSSVMVSAHLFHAGRIYLDNSNNEELSVDSHTIVNLALRFTPRITAPWPGLTFDVRVNNALDTEHETGGYVEPDDGLGRWIVGAERNFYVSLTMGM
ncbi:TonB-dependent receptor, partial [Candidatus Zixiibacteriota bacterium]